MIAKSELRKEDAAILSRYFICVRSFLHLSTIFVRFIEANKSREQSDPGDLTLWCVATRVASRTSRALSRATESHDFSRTPTRLFVGVVVVSCFVRKQQLTAIDRCASQRVAILTSRQVDKIMLGSHTLVRRQIIS